MAAAVFDALTAARQLEDAGIETRQAEAIVTTMARAFDDSVATKAELKADIQQVKAELKTELATAVNRMLLAQLAIAGLLFAALKLF